MKTVNFFAKTAGKLNKNKMEARFFTFVKIRIILEKAGPNRRKGGTLVVLSNGAQQRVELAESSTQLGPCSDSDKLTQSKTASLRKLSKNQVIMLGDWSVSTFCTTGSKRI